MSTAPASNIVERSDLRNQLWVFRDREHAGEVLAQMLAEYHGSEALVMGIPAGGVPVGAVIARTLDLPLDIAVVSKITPPWNTEYGYGALAWDGTVLLNQEALPYLQLSERDMTEGIERARAKVERRVKSLRGDRPFPQVAGRTVILADDGIATGVTTEGAIDALVKMQADRLVLATPTGHEEAVRRLAQKVEKVYCANLRGGGSFAVAQAYQYWSDMSDAEIAEILKKFMP
jgi:predicted phosphoribosyltransferase